MSTPNPYVAPRASVADVPEEYQRVKLFSVSGRIGRARYIAYTLGITLLLGPIGGAIAPAIGEIGILAAYAALAIVSIMLAIQRSHDDAERRAYPHCGVADPGAVRRRHRGRGLHPGLPGLRQARAAAEVVLSLCHSCSLRRASLARGSMARSWFSRLAVSSIT